jgi:hypothetical protein
MKRTVLLASIARGKSVAESNPKREQVQTVRVDANHWNGKSTVMIGRPLHLAPSKGSVGCFPGFWGQKLERRLHDSNHGVA